MPRDAHEAAPAVPAEMLAAVMARVAPGPALAAAAALSGAYAACTLASESHAEAVAVTRGDGGLVGAARRGSLADVRWHVARSGRMQTSGADALGAAVCAGHLGVARWLLGHFGADAAATWFTHLSTYAACVRRDDRAGITFLASMHSISPVLANEVFCMFIGNGNIEGAAWARTVLGAPGPSADRNVAPLHAALGENRVCAPDDPREQAHAAAYAWMLDEFKITPAQICFAEIIGAAAGRGCVGVFSMLVNRIGPAMYETARVGIVAQARTGNIHIVRVCACKIAADARSASLAALVALDGGHMDVANWIVIFYRLRARDFPTWLVANVLRDAYGRCLMDTLEWLRTRSIITREMASAAVNGVCVRGCDDSRAWMMKHYGVVHVCSAPSRDGARCRSDIVTHMQVNMYELRRATGHATAVAGKARPMIFWDRYSAAMG